MSNNEKDKKNIAVDEAEGNDELFSHRVSLDLTPEKSLERIGARADVPTEIYENREYLEKTRKAFFDTTERCFSDCLVNFICFDCRINFYGFA